MTYLDDYEPVEDRLRQFWSDHPNGRVLTELVAESGDPVILFRASVWRDGSQHELIDASTAERSEWVRGAVTRTPALVPDATGYAHQRILTEPPPGRDGPNRNAPEWTSPWEVAETSAIGRALANLGYAAKGGRPSREEVSKASVAGGQSPDAYGEGVTVAPPPATGITSPERTAGLGAGDDATGAGEDQTPPAGPCLHLDGTHVVKRAGFAPLEVCNTCGEPLGNVTT